MAKLYFRYGAMGSSKTANAVMVQYNYQERGRKVLMLKPKLENRDGATIVRSRCGLEEMCIRDSCGIHETKIVTMYMVTTAILCVITLLGVL